MGKQDDLALQEGFGAKLRAFGTSIWDSKRKQIIGRDGMSWAKIGLFYFIFYACLAGFFAAMLAIFMQLTDKKVPTYYLEKSVMANKGVMPGMGFRPQPNVERNLINYNLHTADGNQGWKTYRNALHRHLQEYKKGASEDRVDCSHIYSTNSTEEHHELEDGQFCEFDLKMFDNTPCTWDQDYGYARGNPCVIVKLNRIYNWKPVAYENEEHVPEEIMEHWSEERKDFIYVTCEGENEADRDNIGAIDLYSPLNNKSIGGIPFSFYPFRNQPGYQQPLVFAHFKDLHKGVLVNVECRAFAANIDRQQGDRAFQRGSVHFEFLIDTPAGGRP